MNSNVCKKKALPKRQRHLLPKVPKQCFNPRSCEQRKGKVYFIICKGSYAMKLYFLFNESNVCRWIGSYGAKSGCLLRNYPQKGFGGFCC